MDNKEFYKKTKNRHVATYYRRLKKHKLRVAVNEHKERNKINQPSKNVSYLLRNLEPVNNMDKSLEENFNSTNDDLNKTNDDLNNTNDDLNNTNADSSYSSEILDNSMLKEVLNIINSEITIMNDDQDESQVCPLNQELICLSIIAIFLQAILLKRRWF